MSHQTKTPRQKQGDGLVPLVVRVTPKQREQVRQYAKRGGMSEAYAIRAMLTFWFSDGGRS